MSLGAVRRVPNQLVFPVLRVEKSTTSPSIRSAVSESGRIPEDPATGVAACSLGAYLTHFHVLGRPRPSRILAEAFVKATMIAHTRITGSGTIITEAGLDMTYCKRVN